MKPVKVAYLLSNPIQYQAPMLKYLSQLPNIELEVLFQSQRSLRPHKMPGFNVVAEWDVSLVDGYHYTFLPCLGNDEHFSFFRPWNYGLLKKFRKEKYDVLWVHGYSSFFNLYAIVLAKILGLKVLVRGESHLLAKQKGYWRDKIRKPFFYLLNKLVDGYLTVGTANREFYKNFNINEEKLFFAPYTVDNEFFQQKVANAKNQIEKIKADLNLLSGKPIFLYASSMLSRKNPMDLLEAYANLSVAGVAPEAYLIFVGDGAERSQLEQRIKELGWDTIKIVGFKNQTELPIYYALCDVFVLPSNGETWGLVINEAMNAAKAIIVTNQVGSSYDLVKENENGYLYSPRDVTALTKYLHAIMINPEKTKIMGKKSLEIINHWGIKETANGVREACLQVMSHKNE